MAVSDAPVFPGFLTPVLTQLSFQIHQLLFSNTSGEVRSKKNARKNVRLNLHRTHNLLVMSPAHSSLSHPGWGKNGSKPVASLLYDSFSCKSKWTSCIYGHVLTCLLLDALTLYQTIRTFNNPEKEAF